MPDVPDENGMTAVMHAVKGEHGDCIIKLAGTESKSHLNIKDNDGNSPVMYAVKHGDIGNLTLLLRGEAEPDIQDQDGNTALMIAINRKDSYSLQKLLEYGADISFITNDDGKSVENLVAELPRDEEFTFRARNKVNAALSKRQSTYMQQQSTGGFLSNLLGGSAAGRGR